MQVNIVFPNVQTSLVRKFANGAFARALARFSFPGPLCFCPLPPLFGDDPMRTHRPLLSGDAFGKESYQPHVSWPCRLFGPAIFVLMRARSAPVLRRRGAD